MAKKEVEFFGDYKLRYGWQGLEALSTALDAPAFADFDKIINELGPKQLRVILWAGLLHKYPDLKSDSQEMFGIMDNYLDTHDMESLGNVVGNALMASGILGDSGEDKGEVAGKVGTQITPKNPRKLSKK